MISRHLIREARLRAGLTQQQLAERLETTQSAVARWEAGGARPSLESLTEVARVCGLDLRVHLVDRDEGERSLLDGTLALTPEERFDQLVRTVRFLEEGRRVVMGRRG
ncbi:MAG: helix-turn-helix domain-containing protein [Gemmatimonadetes bacterium]|nr:helix-turn-helix domain-containing protein [Gemmatimonadota bacterium]